MRVDAVLVAAAAAAALVAIFDDQWVAIEV